MPWPDNLLDDNFITRDSAGEEGVNMFDCHIARFPISIKEPFTSFKIVSAGERSSVSSLLRDGMRAIAVSISPDNSAGGLIQPGDIVDVLITTGLNLNDDTAESFGMHLGLRRALMESHPDYKKPIKPKVLAGSTTKNAPSEKFYDRLNSEKKYVIAGADNYTETLLENVRVLGIGQSLNTSQDTNGEPQIGATATLEVTPQQAKLLAWGSAAGRMTLTLRSLVENSVEGDERQLDAIPVTTSTFAIPIDDIQSDAEHEEAATDQLDIIRSSARPSTVHAPSFDMLRATTESNSLPESQISATEGRNKMKNTLFKSVLGTFVGTVISMTLPASIAHAGNVSAKPDLISYIQGNTNKTRHINIPRNKEILKLPRASRDVIDADPELLDVVVRSPKEVYLSETNRYD